jgi:hypothetical protein
MEISAHIYSSLDRLGRMRQSSPKNAEERANIAA